MAAIDLQEDDQALENFLCPITYEVMRDPVIIETGHSFERESIQRWFDNGNRTNPATGAELSSLVLFPNHSLRNAIEEYIESLDQAENDAADSSLSQVPAPSTVVVNSRNDLDYALDLSRAEYDRDQLRDWTTVKDKNLSRKDTHVNMLQKKLKSALMHSRRFRESKRKAENNLSKINSRLLKKGFNARDINTKANLLKKLFRYEEAIDLLRGSLEKEADNKFLLGTFGNVLFLSGQYDQSLEVFDKLLSVDNNNIHALDGKGKVYWSLGMLDHARTCYNSVLTVDPDNSHALVAMARIDNKPLPEKISPSRGRPRGGRGYRGRSGKRGSSRRDYSNRQGRTYQASNRTSTVSSTPADPDGAAHRVPAVIQRGSRM